MNSQPLMSDQTTTADTKAVRLIKAQEKHNKAVYALYCRCNGFFVSDDTLAFSTLALSEILQHWIETEYVREVRESIDDDDELDYSNKLLRAGFDVLRLITSLYNDLDNIRLSKAEIQSAEKEVSHE